MKPTLKRLLGPAIVFAALNIPYASQAQALPYRAPLPNDPKSVATEQKEPEYTGNRKIGRTVMGVTAIVGLIAANWYMHNRKKN